MANPLFGHVIGWMVGSNPSITFDHNAIQFNNSPIMGTAMTFGNVIVYGSGYEADHTFSSDWTSTGHQEMQHTYQAQVLGPLYFPGHLFFGTMALITSKESGLITRWHGDANYLERGPHSRDPHPW